MLCSEFDKAFDIEKNEHPKTQVDLDCGQRFIERTIGLALKRLFENPDIYYRCKDVYERLVSGEEVEGFTDVNFNGRVVMHETCCDVERYRVHGGCYLISDGIWDALEIKRMEDRDDCVYETQKDCFGLSDEDLIERFKKGELNNALQSNKDVDKN